jgi:hypothetical protein
MISEFNILIAYWAFALLMVVAIFTLFKRTDANKRYFSFMKYALIPAAICAFVVPYVILEKYSTRVWIIQDTEDGQLVKKEMRFFGSPEYTFKNQKKVTLQMGEHTSTVIINDSNHSLQSTPIYYGGSGSRSPVSIQPMDIYDSPFSYKGFGIPPQSIKTSGGGRVDYWLTW